MYIRKFGWTGAKLYLMKKMKFPRFIRTGLPGFRAVLGLRPDTSDLDVFQQVFVEEEYLFPLDQEPEIIVDAGANIGLASIYYALAYPDAKIIAIEPEESNYTLLKENIRSYPNIVPIQRALWHIPVPLKIANPRDGKFAFRVEASGKETDLPSITMGELMALYDLPFIDILKMDIEGAEKEVFSGQIDWLSRIGVIAIELHDHIKTGCSRAFYSAVSPFVDREEKKGENLFIVTTNRKKGPSKIINRKKHAIYVLHVKKGYEEREKSINEQFSRLAMGFEWVLDHDRDEITGQVLDRYQYQGNITIEAVSCSLKHICAWERIAQGEADGAFVFEDDALINLNRFSEITAKALAEYMDQWEGRGYISLGSGCALYVPWTRTRRHQLLYPARYVRATDSYWISRGTAREMVAWIGKNGFSLPADHLIDRICSKLNIPILWLAPTLVNQGSHTGLFSSSIQAEERGKWLDRLEWKMKIFRRKYLYPLLGKDLTKIDG